MNIRNVLFYSVLISSTCINSIEKSVITVKQYQRSSQFALLDPAYDRTKIVVNAIIDNKPTRYISFITDNEDNQYVIKQRKKGSTIKEQFSSVFEKLSAHTAEIVDIPAHKVQFLPAGMIFPGKIFADEVATILTFVPGVSIKFIKSGPYKGINIRQNNNPLLPKEQLGLTESIITHMSLHPDLASIVALDTFICNDDRHSTNCFYDEITDRFYAIDMDKVYNIKDYHRDLVSKLACDQIREMIRTKKSFSQRELYGLRVYKETLQQLVSLLPPGHICTLLDEFAIIGGFNKKAYVEEVVNLSTRVKKKIEQSYKHVLELIGLLAELIK